MYITHFCIPTRSRISFKVSINSHRRVRFLVLSSDFMFSEVATNDASYTMLYRPYTKISAFRIII